MARLERLSERYTFRYGMTEREMWTPLCEFDGSKTVKQALFSKIPAETGDLTALNKAAKDVLEICQQEPIDISKANNKLAAFIAASNGFEEDPTLYMVEKAKVDYIKKVVEWHINSPGDVPFSTGVQYSQFNIEMPEPTTVSKVQIKDPQDNPLAITGDAVQGILNHLETLKQNFQSSHIDEAMWVQSVAIQWERAKALSGEVSSQQLDQLFKFRFDILDSYPLTASDKAFIKKWCSGEGMLTKSSPHSINLARLSIFNYSDIKNIEGDVIDNSQLKKLFDKLFTHYKDFPGALAAHLRGEKLDENDLPADIKGQLERIFKIGARWDWGQQQALIEHTMSWPPQLREWLAEVPGLFEGRRGLVMDTVTQDPGVVLHRYMERVAGVDNVDANWSTMLHFAVQHKASLNAITEGIEGRIHLDGFKYFISAQISQVLLSILVTESGDDIQVNGRIEELTQITESLADLEALRIDIAPILRNVLDTKLYQAKTREIQTIQRNIAATIMAKLMQVRLTSSKP